MSSGFCVSKKTENLLTLSPLYRDYWGEQMAVFTRRLDRFAHLGCYVPRFYHAPDSASQFVGVQPNDYRTYLLSLPIGSFIIGFLHTTSSAATGRSPDSGIAASVPPNPSGFSVQITDLSIDHKWFSHPCPEAWFINDNLLDPGVFPPYPENTLSYTFPSFPRLLSQPYPVVGQGQFQVEFYNSLDTVNTDVQLTFLVLVPDGPDANAGRVSNS